MKIMQELNIVRAEIIKRHYGAPVIGKPGELLTVVKFWDVLNMGVNIFLTKPNTQGLDKWVVKGHVRTSDRTNLILTAVRHHHGAIG